MSTNYERELSKLAETYAAAFAAPASDIDKLKAAIRSASESSLIAVGSGGSFTTALLLCNLHETYTGRVSRASTPLEIICNPTLASSSPVFLISAEGKNPDICEALERARQHSARTLHVLTNREKSKLMECVEKLPDVTPHVFSLVDKDGYLATNSLLLDAMLVARVYAELDRAENKLPKNFGSLKIGIASIEEWAERALPFVAEASKRGALTVIYSPLLKPIAADLESKLSESALMHVQLADLRSFAHGRHLWLANRPQDCAILALVEPSVGDLWHRMKDIFPADVPTLTMPLSGASPEDLITGLIAQMHLVSLIGNFQSRDVGRPSVPQFGRDLYYIDLPSVIPPPAEIQGAAEKSKFEVLGARWPSELRRPSMRRARESFEKDIASRAFRAIVFDYDGTLCSSQRTDSPPTKAMLEQLERLVRAGVMVGIASGRGGSVQEHLTKNLPADVVEKIQLGLYNCGWINNASVSPVESNETSEFLSHVARIVIRLKQIGVPINTIRSTHPYQVSIRFREGLSTDAMWFVVGDALRQDGLDLSSMVRSKHSIDVLANGISKSRLIAHIVTTFKIEPYDIMTMGDQGAWPGNDSALLEHRYSLSVDEPSRRLDRGWKLAPANKRDVDAALWYLDRFRTTEDGQFKFDLTSLNPEGQ
jgi:HAD superfamily hydrolase (TIGR01484 family)